MQVHGFGFRYLYKSNSSCLCHCENSKPFCLAKSWPCTKTRRGSKILDVNVCHILLLQVQLSGGFVLKLQNFILAVLPLRRIKKTKVQSLHWSFGFIEISTLTPSMRSKIQKTIHYFGFHTRVVSTPPIILLVNFDSWWQNQMSLFEFRHDRPSGRFSKSWGLSTSVSFLSSPPPPRSFTCAIFHVVFDSHSSFFAPKPHGNACYAGYVAL